MLLVMFHMFHMFQNHQFLQKPAMVNHGHVLTILKCARHGLKTIQTAAIQEMPIMNL
jgi:hypothetical protein